MKSRELKIEAEGGKGLLLTKGHWQCGKAYHGMELTILGDRAGGVLRLDDLVKLRDFINEHLENVLNDKRDIPDIE